jgi:HD-GYP domain-containing protein (c-di-GMP phosphodiesterase class II)
MYTPVQQLAIGMYVAELDRPWLDSPFHFQGFFLKTSEDVMAVQEVCRYVYIDTTRQRRAGCPAVVTPSKTEHTGSPNVKLGEPPPRLSEFKDEIGRADVAHRQVGQLVSGFMDRIGRGEGIDTDLAKEAVAECVDSILHSPDAFLWLNQLKNKDEYTAQHSLNVCVLSIVLGRHVGFSEADLNNVGLCGMMHDMGKMMVPLDILNKPGKLDDGEMGIMRTHTSLGHELLKSSPGMFLGAIKTALSHHETLDGKGYPNRTDHREICLFTRVVTIADMYDAITSDRVYQKGRTHLDAISIMSNQSGTQLDSRLVVKFIEALGVYPPGVIVKMTNGAIAIVVEINERSRLRPKVIILLDPSGQAVDESVIDLAEMPVDARRRRLTINGIVKAQDHGIDIAKYYQAGILQKGFGHG